MTPLNKAVNRMGCVPYRGRRLVVTLYPGDVVALRQERTRKEYSVPMSWIYEMAVKHEVRQAKAEKAAARKAKGKR